MMKILCIGDSLSLPGHSNDYEDTWIYKLRQKYKMENAHFITFFQRALTTDALIRQGGDGSDCLEIYNPDIVILQLGIVDCAPRLIVPNSFNYFVVKLLPGFIKKKYIRLIKLYQGRKSNKVYVKIDKFKKNIDQYLERCKKINVKQVVVIGICIPDEKMIAKSPEIIKNVHIYNKVFKDLSFQYKTVDLIFPLDPKNSNDTIYEDGYHPNPTGNKLVFQDLISILRINE